MQPLVLLPLTGIGEIGAATPAGACGASALAGILHAALRRGGHGLESGDVLVIAQKAVSKSEGRTLDLNTLIPSPRALELAAITHKDPQLVEAILRESTTVVRAKPGVLIVRHRLGYVMAQAGIDRSNLPATRDGTAPVLLLPADPDASAAALRAALATLAGVEVGIIISDSFGRPWRVGTTNVAIGSAGVAAVWDRRGETDRAGRPLEATVIANADALAAAAGVVMGETTEGIPAVLIRGYTCPAPHRTARELIRPLEEDMFQ